MKCYKHNDLEAVGKCSSCGVSLCGDCYTTNEYHLCDACAKKRITKITFIFIRNMIFMIILAGISISMQAEPIFFFMALGFPFGWSAVSKFKLGLWLNGNFLFVYVVLKLMIAGLIGIVLTPYAIYKMYLEYNSLKLQIHND